MSSPALRGRMLYLVGGPGNAERVDVSDLFVKTTCSATVCRYTHVIFSREPSRCLANNTMAWRVRLPSRTLAANAGSVGSVINKLIEFAGRPSNVLACVDRSLRYRPDP